MVCHAICNLKIKYKGACHDEVHAGHNEQMWVQSRRRKNTHRFDICDVHVAIGVGVHSEDLREASDLCLVQGVREQDGEVDVQVALVEGLGVDGHALILDAFPAVGLDDMACGAGDLQHSAIQVRDVELGACQCLCKGYLLQQAPGGINELSAA